MIGTRVEVEYEENVDGVVKYLDWIKGTVMDYHKVNGYLVQFPDDVDWIKILLKQERREDNQVGFRAKELNTKSN